MTINLELSIQKNHIPRMRVNQKHFILLLKHLFYNFPPMPVPTKHLRNAFQEEGKLFTKGSSDTHKK